MELVIAGIVPHDAAGGPAVDVEQNDPLQLGELLEDTIKVELEGGERRGEGREGGEKR